ncbi:hypothetical protein DICPUDRAFT_43907 [Dictyostelium purpureum]|uniref:Thioesterase domain-containing protein n=1 Tax=Dictyostelium purpureum TaxID=5786 RepID=F1A524_DICPU|nr:uncharacterized protein DICPUDRAFT_43907 [Dictyostelium purpureum]EGC28703.1 hypothetical protein DICPUDRAFT_43907 [Dictyostelium purpureum]|eukprot:XP_003294768.1 hypothetical protein DICPUDRAFT_43907 [Dictyostelium purpureum]
MGRVQIKQLNNYIHHFKRQIRTTDLNCGSNLDHTAVIKMVHDARAECFRNLGFSEKNLLPNSDMVSIVVGDLQAQYLNDGQLFEDLIIETDFIERSNCGFRMTHRIKSIQPFGSPDLTERDFNSNNNSNDKNHKINASGATFKNIALVEVGIIAVSPITKKPVQLPDSFFKLLGLKKPEVAPIPSSNKL